MMGIFYYRSFPVRAFRTETNLLFSASFKYSDLSVLTDSEEVNC